MVYKDRQARRLTFYDTYNSDNIARKSMVGVEIKNGASKYDVQIRMCGVCIYTWYV
jgi:hypothetical protein